MDIVIDQQVCHMNDQKFNIDDYIVYPLAVIVAGLVIANLVTCYREYQEKRNQLHELAREKQISFKIRQREAQRRANEFGAQAGEMSRQILKHQESKDKIEQARQQILTEKGSLNPLESLHLNALDGYVDATISSLSQDREYVQQHQQRALESAADNAYLADYVAKNESFASRT